MKPQILSLIAALALPGAAAAQVGQPLPDAELTDFTATEAKSLTDFKGRLLLIEFFAYW